MRKSYQVLILPSAGNGTSFTEIIEAVNPPQARAIAKARFPKDWKIGSTCKEV